MPPLLHAAAFEVKTEHYCNGILYSGIYEFHTYTCTICVVSSQGGWGEGGGRSRLFRRQAACSIPHTAQTVSVVVSSAITHTIQLPPGVGATYSMLKNLSLRTYAMWELICELEYKEWETTPGGETAMRRYLSSIVFYTYTRYLYTWYLVSYMPPVYLVYTWYIYLYNIYDNTYSQHSINSTLYGYEYARSHLGVVRIYNVYLVVYDDLFYTPSILLEEEVGGGVVEGLIRITTQEQDQ